VAGEEFGEERVRAAVEGLTAESPERVLDALLRALETFALGVPQFDDLTAVVVRYRG